MTHEAEIQAQIRKRDPRQALNGDHHVYHRWVCSCGAEGPWGHALWAMNSIRSAEAGARRHIEDTRCETCGGSGVLEEDVSVCGEHTTREIACPDCSSDSFPELRDDADAPRDTEDTHGVRDPD